MTALAQCFGGIMLLCALALLIRHRLAAMISLYTLQTLALFAAAFAQAFAQHSWSLAFVALVTFIKAALFPIALKRIQPLFNSITGLPAGLALLLGLGLICIATLAVHPLGHPNLAIALAILLLGLSITVMRREPIAQLIGFLFIENGLLLAAIGIPALLLLPGICIALFALSALLLASAYRMAGATA